MAIRRKTRGRNVSKPRASAKEVLTDSIETIEERLRSYTWNIRLKAVKELGKLDDKEKILGLLVKMLGDRSSKVLVAVADVLGNVAGNEKTRDATLEILKDKLYDEHDRVRMCAADALAMAAGNEKSRDTAFGILKNALSDDNDYELQLYAIWALKSATGKGVDISGIVGELGGLLSNTTVGSTAAQTLEKAAKNGVDMSAAFETLVKALSEGDSHTGERAVEILINAAEKGGHNTRMGILSTVMGVIRSEWFISGADQNSMAYERTVMGLGAVMQKIEELEREAA